MTPEERTDRARKAGRARWADVADRAAATERARRAAEERLSDDPAERIEHFRVLGEMRQGLRPRGPVGERPECGSTAGESSHRRHGELICDACRAAKRADARRHWRKRGEVSGDH